MAAWLLLVLAASTAAVGQGRPRSWRRGPLAMQEFVTMLRSGDSASHLEQSIIYSLAGVDEGLHTYFYCRTGAVMYPAASWMAEGHRDSNELAYNQALFDLAEIHRREMQWQSLTLPRRRKGRYDRLLEATLMDLQREVSVMQAATDCGRDTAVLERMRRRNREWLAAHPCERPQFALRPFWWGVGLQFGAFVPTGGLARCFSASVGAIGYDVGMGWGRHGFYLRSMRGNVQAVDTLRDSWGSVYDPHYVGAGLVHADLGVAYGYNLFDNDRFSVTPYAGYGMSSTSIRYWWDFYAETYTVGVVGRYHFHHWHSIRDGLKGKAERLTASAMANVYASYSKYDEDLGEVSGLTVGLRLGLQLTVRRERVDYPPSQGKQSSINL